MIGNVYDKYILLSQLVLFLRHNWYHG